MTQRLFRLLENNTVISKYIDFVVAILNFLKESPPVRLDDIDRSLSDQVLELTIRRGHVLLLVLGHYQAEGNVAGVLIRTCSSTQQAIVWANICDIFLHSLGGY